MSGVDEVVREGLVLVMMNGLMEETYNSIILCLLRRKPKQIILVCMLAVSNTSTKELNQLSKCVIQGKLE